MTARELGVADVGSPTELALFAGAGGGCLASKWLLGWRTVCYVEINPYRQKVLQTRIADGLLDDAPIWNDVTTFVGRPWRGHVDCISGGFPCTPWSTAGQRRGADDQRNLWPDTLRIIREVGPAIAFLENVPPLIRQPYFRDEILGALAEGGYDAVWGVFSATQVGAPHLRQRLFVLACAHGWRPHSEQELGGGFPGKANPHWDGKDGVMANADRDGRQQGPQVLCSRQSILIHGGEDVAYAPGVRLEGAEPQWQEEDAGQLRPQLADRRWPLAGSKCAGLEIGTEQELLGEREATERSGLAADTDGLPQNWPTESWGEHDYWTVEPDVGRVAPRLASRVDRLAALGDGQVPLTVAYAYATLFERAFGITL